MKFYVIDFLLFVIEVLTYQNFGSYVLSVAFHPTKNLLASCSADTTIRTWDITSGSCLSTLSGHSYPVTSVCWNNDGTKLASGSADKTVKVWDTTTGECLWTLSGEKQVFSVAFSPDGSLIAAGDGDQFANDKTGTIRLYSTATGDPFGSPLNVGYAFSRFSTRISLPARPLFSRFSTRISV